MKPRTKIQKRAEELSSTLKPISPTMQERFRKATPDCKYKRYYAVLDRAGEFSVVRYYSYHRHNRKQDECSEFMQVWVCPDGYSVRAKERMMSMYYDIFKSDSPLTTRSNNRNYSFNRLTSIGYSRLFIRSRKAQRAICNYRKQNYFLIGKQGVWLSDEIDIKGHPFFETILKQAPDVAERMLSAHVLCSVTNNDLRIAWKHRYFNKNLDYRMWADTVHMGRNIALDMRNPIYLCPQNLKIAHDYYYRRHNALRAKRANEEAARLLLQDAEAKKRYAEFISRFACLSITDGNLSVRPLMSVEEFKAEGEAMHHCVFVCGYYKRSTSLILTATVNGKRAETVEVNLTNYEIAQSRGADNQPSQYHDRIVALVRKHMTEIQTLNIAA